MNKQKETQKLIGSPGAFSGFDSKYGPSNDDLNKCVHCGFCLSACPTYLQTGNETESPRGRIALMKMAKIGSIAITPTVTMHWDLCLQCRACEVACPSGVPYGRLMEQTRTAVNRQLHQSMKTKFLKWLIYRQILGHPTVLSAVGFALKYYKKLGIQYIARKIGVFRLLPRRFMLLDENMPILNKTFFKADDRLVKSMGKTRAKVIFLAGCVMRMTDPSALHATVRVLSINGVDIKIPENQGCCGAVTSHAGENKITQDRARRNIDTFLSEPCDAIIVASAGCGSTMKEYGDLLKDDPQYFDKAKRIAELTKDVHEFLFALGLKPPNNQLNLTVTYQDPCHLLNAQRISEAPRYLLDQIPGLTRTEMAEGNICCGSAGAYSITQPEMSKMLTQKKVNNIVATSADIVATANPGCSMQISTALRTMNSNTRVRYVMEILSEAYSV